MTNLTQLEKRACEIVAETLQGAIDEADMGYEKELRLRIACLWEKYPDDFDKLLHAIYLDSLLVRITGLTDSDAASDLTNFKSLAEFTGNSFMAPILVYASRMLDWEAISIDCANLFFSPKLMGDFDSPQDAIEEFSDSYGYD